MTGGDLPADCWDRIRCTLAGGLTLAFFLDLDGTLAPLAPVPHRARVPVAVREILQDLHSFPRCQVWVVTGRPAAEALRLVGIPEIGYAGVHGLEVRWPGPEGNTRYPVNLDAFLPAVAAARQALYRELASVPGCLVEDKGISVAVHYRGVNPPRRPEVLRAVRRVARGNRLLRLQPGHDVMELRPNVAWDKGRAVMWLLESTQGGNWWKRALPIYVGDDRTDEDAFTELAVRGVTIKVGRGPTAARYRLGGPEDVALFLKACRRLLSDPPVPG